MTELTQDSLKDVIHYDPDTGAFTWARGRPGCRRGDPCGRVNTGGYLEIGVFGRLHHAQRLAVLYMTGVMPPQSVDHINFDRLDNRWSNLRCASQSQNMANVRLRATNTSGVHGVTWDKDRQKWRAQLRVGGKQVNLGRYDSKDEASEVVKAAAREQWGDFASWAAE